MIGRRSCVYCSSDFSFPIRGRTSVPFSCDNSSSVQNMGVSKVSGRTSESAASERSYQSTLARVMREVDFRTT